MIRISIIVSVLLTFSANAKPLIDNSDAHLKEMVVSMDGKGRLSWGVEVEPPEDMDENQFQIDPRLRIWKNMKNGQDRNLKPEEDLDDLFHRFVEPVLPQEEPEARADPPFQRKYNKPEEDLDDLFHKNVVELVLPREEPEAPADPPSQRKYNKPEEDLDDLFHKNFVEPVLPQEA